MICPATGKDVYSTKRKAKKAVVDLDKRKGRLNGIQTNSYFCDRCNGWHFGRKTIVRKNGVKK